MRVERATGPKFEQVRGHLLGDAAITREESDIFYRLVARFFVRVEPTRLVYAPQERGFRNLFRRC